MKQKTFTMKERQILEERWEKGDGAAEIAVEMGFSPAAVYRELKRGEARDETTGELMLDVNQRKKYSAERGRRSTMPTLETVAAVLRRPIKSKEELEMGKFRECPHCGAHLDHGEICECQKGAHAGEAVKTEAEKRAMQEGLDAEVTIYLKKEAGNDKFRRTITASSSSAAVNGLAVLVREYAYLLGVSVVEILAVLATVLAVPAIQNSEGAK